MRSWEECASESTFSVQMTALQSAETSSSSGSSKRRLPCNKRPCGRCSDRHKKCDIFPPYSPTRCGACAKANLPSCPPHKSRRSSSTLMKAPSNLIYTPEQPRATDSGPATSQSTAAGTHFKSDRAEYETTDTAGIENLGQFFEPTNVELDYANILASSQVMLAANNPAFGGFEQTAFDGALNPASSLLLYNSQFPHFENVSSSTSFVLPASFDSVFFLS